uniref:Tf2-1-like SH3-like domain-containing protein n=1 Tax=Ananas comosus var. bracteatus TaxID=296719 RepID=A0A6V7NY88_ANACO|nr:unnamed protein product [Ananas comosus var. bracteatus]
MEHNWLKKDRIARITLLSSVQDDFFCEYEQYATAYDIWEAFKTKFGVTSAERSWWRLNLESSEKHESSSRALGSSEYFRLEIGNHVLLKVSPTRGITRFGIRGKLSPRFIGSYEILERVGPVAYRLALPPNLSDVHNVFHVSVLRKYIHDSAHVLNATPLELREDLSFEEQPVRILAREVKRLRNREIPYVKVLRIKFKF